MWGSYKKGTFTAFHTKTQLCSKKFFRPMRLKNTNLPGTASNPSDPIYDYPGLGNFNMSPRALLSAEWKPLK